VRQRDFSLELAEALFSGRGLARVEAAIRAGPARRTAAVRHFLRQAPEYRATVDAVRRFLQGKDPTLALRVAGRQFLPEGPRFAAADDAQRLFGPLGTQDFARHLASLYLDDLADAIREGVDSRFALARHGEGLALRAPCFDPLRRALEDPPTLVDRMIDGLVDRALADGPPPDLVGLTVPFPGTVYGAFRAARRVRRRSPRALVVIGGGYVTTELRGLSDPRVFDYVDYVVLDDGDTPLLRLLASLRAGRRRPAPPACTFARAAGRAIYGGDAPRRPGGPSAWRPARPRYEDLPLDRYLGLPEMPNPVQRLWSDGAWLKVPLTHGCYWRRCRFCDTSLDAISRYAAPPPARIAAQLAALVRRTGRTGFHFTDEALPPGLLRGLAQAILARGLAISWWGNIRFESGFDDSLAGLLSASGCVAVTGGLECADNRLLRRMDKGIDLRTASRVCASFARAGVLVHAYLMYGFPGQTRRDAFRALERVRRLFRAGCLHSAYWHRFALTVHSPMAANPAAYGIRLLPEMPATFGRNEIPYREPGAPDWKRIGPLLHRATYNYMLGRGLERRDKTP
jgi:hypothetical protein